LDDGVFSVVLFRALFTELVLFVDFEIVIRDIIVDEVSFPLVCIC